MKKKKRSGSPNAFKTVGIGLLGLGTVGTGVYKALTAQKKAIEEKTGVSLELRRICVRSLKRKRAMKVPKHLLTTDPKQLLNDPDVDILVELMGGLHPAKEILLDAFDRGKHVVTANKALLAESGNALFDRSQERGSKLGIEASVCGGIPIIKSLKEGLVSNDVEHFLGIVNGTCNYILTEMSEKGIRFDDALKDAQARGYAELDPRLDVDGIDSAHKLAILARLAFRSYIPFKQIFVEGIRGISITDIGYAKELGYVIKLLAVGKRTKEGLDLRVHPALLPLSHPLSNVRGVYNAVYVQADQAGDLLFYGRGAGMYPTASAVMSDILDIAKRIGEPGTESPLPSPLAKTPLRPIGDLKANYYLRFQAKDRPGVLGRIAQALGRHNISILSVHQKESHDTKSVPVVILTYEASEKDVRKALAVIDAEKEISRKTVVLRVEK